MAAKVQRPIKSAGGRSEQAVSGTRYILSEASNAETPPQGKWKSLSVATSATRVAKDQKASVKGKRQISANEVAEYFLAKCDEDAGDLISNLKLQKLLYYAQGFCLALTGNPLFSEPLEAWTHGPVVRVVYDRFKNYGSLGLPTPEQIPDFDSAVRELLDEVYAVYGQFSAWKLRNLTHDESPWRDTDAGQTIPQNLLKAHFETQLV